MTLTVNAKSYTAQSFGPKTVGYSGPGHTISVKDDIKITQAEPKPTATFAGVAKASVKLTRTLDLDNGGVLSVGNGIVEINTSIPVGADSADIDAMLNDMGAALASASYKEIVKTSKISF